MVRVYLRKLDREAARGDGEVLLRQIFGNPHLTVCHDEKGRPYLDGGPQISISHSGNYVLTAVADRPVGVDGEVLREIPDRLPRRVMSDGEYAFYRENGADPHVFFTLWTLKESYYKYLGRGLPGFPNQTKFRYEDGRWELAGSSLRFFTEDKKDLLIALCCDEQEYTLITLE